MTCWLDRDVPILAFDHARIKNAFQNVGYELNTDGAVLCFWKCVKTFKEALYFNLCLEATRREAFKAFLDN
ncbi:MAG: hypothetical protein CMK07_09415 [Ponticaulis sp.]|nr:hypothetical protein [Ponticaulis sp.]